jgi:hypothetical protein
LNQDLGLSFNQEIRPQVHIGEDTSMMDAQLDLVGLSRMQDDPRSVMERVVRAEASPKIFMLRLLHQCFDPIWCVENGGCTPSESQRTMK